MVSFSRVTSCALVVLSHSALSQDAPECVADEIEAVVGVMNSAAKESFDECSVAVGFDFNVNLPGYLAALAVDCSAPICNEALNAVLPFADQVPTCTFHPAAADAPGTLFLDAIVAASESCSSASDSPTVTPAPSLPTCTTADVTAVVDAMNEVAPAEFTACNTALGVDFNTDLVGFLVAVSGDCSNTDCATGISEVVGIADQLPQCVINNPANPIIPPSVNVLT